MKSRKLFATAAVAAASLVSASSWGFSFKDIKYWIGSGTNECAVVIDFNDGSVANSSFAWGYRWNDDAPSFKTILDEISADDPRLASFVSDSGWVSGFGYDVDDDGGTFQTGKTYTKSDKDDLFPQPRYEYDDSEYDDDEIDEPNMYMVGDDWAAAYATGETFEALEWRRTDAVTTGVFPVNGQWLVQRFAAYSMEMTGWTYIVDEFAPEKTPAAATRTFRLGDIRYWVGAGANTAGIAISWGAGRTRAWGCRWNGEAPTVKEALESIASADRRLVPHITSESWGYNLDTFGYDAGDVGGVTYNWKTYSASDASAWIVPYSTDYVDPDDWNTWIYHYFNLVTEPDGFFRTGAAAYSWSEVGIGELRLADGAWVVLAYNEGDYLAELDASIAAAEPAAALAASLPKVGGDMFASLDGAFFAARGGKAVTLPEESCVDAAAKRVTIGTDAAGTLQTYAVPEYFDMSVSGKNVVLALNAAAAPTIAASGEDSPFSVTSTTVRIVPGNVIDGLWYGIAAAEDVSGGFSAPAEWVCARSGKVVLERTRKPAAKGEFFKIVVSDAPGGGR